MIKAIFILFTLWFFSSCALNPSNPFDSSNKLKDKQNEIDQIDKIKITKFEPNVQFYNDLSFLACRDIEFNLLLEEASVCYIKLLGAGTYKKEDQHYLAYRILNIYEYSVAMEELLKMNLPMEKFMEYTFNLKYYFENDMLLDKEKILNNKKNLDFFIKTLLD